MTSVKRIYFLQFEAEDELKTSPHSLSQRNSQKSPQPSVPKSFNDKNLETSKNAKPNQLRFRSQSLYINTVQQSQPNRTSSPRFLTRKPSFFEKVFSPNTPTTPLSTSG